MKKILNNKGYMLVEIILASAIAMGVAYFIIDLSIKLKNKNDDLLVKTLVYTDQAIIYNELANYLYNSTNPVTCTNLPQITTSNNTFTFNGFKNIVSEYATLGSSECIENSDTITIKIPITVKQLKDEFNIELTYINQNQGI